MRQLNEFISVLPASENPLSADVVFVRTEQNTVIFDVGACEEALKLIEAVEGPRLFVISHFHGDHMANLNRIGFRPDDRIYGGDFTCKKVETAIPVISETEPENSEKVRLLPMPSSHSKGALVMEVGDYAFTGDGTYPGKGCYNVSLLSQTIKTLDSLNAEWLFLSHNPASPVRKGEVVSELKNIYARRIPGEAYINYNEFK